MMVIKRYAVFTIVFSLIFLGCNSNDDPTWPDCIHEKIDEIKSMPVANPPREIWEWQVGDSKYYYITSVCCDQFNLLYTGSCEVVCAPDGGITGQGDGNCSDELLKSDKKLIWKDDRRQN